MRNRFMFLFLCLFYTGITFAQPLLVEVIPTGSEQFTKVGDQVFFTSGDSLMVTDGTTGGTGLVKSGFNDPGRLFEANGLLYFITADGEFWRSDATNGGTIKLKEFSSSHLEYAIVVGSNLYFHAEEAATGRELYLTDGTVTGTILLKDINPGSANGIDFTNYVTIGNIVYFQATDATHGKELWKTNGTPAGTILVKDINPGTGSSDISEMWSALGEVYFAANDGVHGSELWKSNGTEAGTLLTKDINPGPADGFVSDTILTANNHVFFIANNGTHGLWKTDGSVIGTELVKDLDPGPIVFEIKLLYDLNDTVYFYLTSDQTFTLELWRSDGTEAGTINYKTFNSFIFSLGEHILLNGIFYAVIHHSGDSFSLLTTDGTSDGSYVIPVACCGDTNSFGMTVVNDHVVFGSTGQFDFFGGYFKSNGTPEGSGPFTPGSIQRPPSQAVVGNLFFFPQDEGPTDPGGVINPTDFNQLKVSDLTTTTSLRTLHGVSLAGSDNLFNLNGKLLFTTFNSRSDASPDQKIKRLWIYNPDTTTCFSTGAIVREFWDNETGTTIASVPFNTEMPDTTYLITSSFEGPSNIGTFYGARYRGYICAPVTGDYTFWITSNDHSELWLSKDEQPNHKIKIASVTGFANPLQWNKYPSQQSSPIHLVEGKKYFIEALHKQNAGTDHLAVGWQLPGSTLERPIPGHRLSPYSNQSPTVEIVSPNNQQVFIEPVSVTIRAEAEDIDGSVVKVEFYRNDVKIGEDLTAPFTHTINNAGPASYFITARAYDNSGAVTVSASIFFNVRISDEAFVLVDADNDQDLYGIADQSIIPLFDGRHINIRYNPVNNPESVVFAFNGTIFSTDNDAPFALAGDASGNYHVWTPIEEGRHRLEALEYSNDGGTGTLLTVRVIEFFIDSIEAPDGQFITHFTLIDALNDQTIDNIENGEIIDLSKLPTTQLNIVAHAFPATVGSVRFNLDGDIRIENVAPYAYFGDNSGNYLSGNIATGEHTLTGTPYTGPNASGTAGTPLSINFTVINSGMPVRLANITSVEFKEPYTYYPNPVSDYFHLILNANQESFGMIEIYDARGLLIDNLFEGNLTQGENGFGWESGNQIPGIYLLKVTMNNKVYTETIIVK